MELTEGAGVDVAIEAVGSNYFRYLASYCRAGGRIANVASTANR